MAPSREMIPIIISFDEKTKDAPRADERAHDIITQPRVNFLGVNSTRLRLKISRTVQRPRWTLDEDCKLLKMVANHRGTSIWPTIAKKFQRRDGNGCRLRWEKLSNYDDIHTQNRWVQIINTKGYGAIYQWRYMISRYNDYLFSRLPANHPFKQPPERIEGTGSSGQPVEPIINNPVPGGVENDDGVTSIVTAATPTRGPPLEMFVDVDLTLRLAINDKEIRSPLLQPRPKHPYHDFIASKFS